MIFRRDLQPDHPNLTNPNIISLPYGRITTGLAGYIVEK